MDGLSSSSSRQCPRPQYPPRFSTARAFLRSLVSRPGSTVSIITSTVLSLTRPLLALVVLLTLLPDVASAQTQSVDFSDAQVSLVVERLAEGAQQSWELGTEQQALTELDTPSYSVLNTSSLPPSSSSPPSSLSPVFQLITEVVANRTSLIASNSSLSEPQPFFPSDGSAADPASNGVAALLANWTGQGSGNSSLDFGQAAEEQMAFLWSSKVPKTQDGAFSHRVSQVQLWSDFIYMVPPFLAYYGVLTANQSMVKSAYTQIALYRNYLSDPSTNNLWRHIVMGSDFQDLGYWSTGNGWAAAGMLRVLATIGDSQYRSVLKSEMTDLKNWVNEIQDGMYLYMRSDGMFHNYANDNSTFVDAASAALLASTVYRQAILSKTYRHLPNAEFVRQQLWSTNSSSNSSSTSSGGNSTSSNNTSSALANMAHFTTEGWLTPVVDPYNFAVEGSQSPESQAFVVMMYSAWRDWVALGAVGANSGRRVRGDIPMRVGSVGGGVLLALVCGVLLGGAGI